MITPRVPGPSGSKDPNIRALGPKYGASIRALGFKCEQRLGLQVPNMGSSYGSRYQIHSDYSISALKPQYLGHWTLGERVPSYRVFTGIHSYAHGFFLSSQHFRGISNKSV